MRRKDRKVADKTEIQDILHKADACRLGFAVDNMPYIVCMNYGFEWNDDLPVFYFHCAHEGLKLELMEKNSYVCFQLDTEHGLFYIPEKVYCTMNYSSVVGMGYLNIVQSEEERKKGLGLLMQHHGHPAPKAYPDHSMTRTTVLRLDVTELSAKRNAPSKQM